MVNALAKGKRIEALARKLLERDGWICYRPPWNRWGEKDIFSWGDILAVKRWYEPHLIQVRTRSGGSPSALKKDGKIGNVPYLKECGMTIVLLLYGGKRRKIVPEWEARLYIKGDWQHYSTLLT